MIWKNINTNLFKDLGKTKAVLAECLAGSSLEDKLEDALKNCIIGNITAKTTCYTFEETMTNVQNIGAAINCILQTLEFGPYSKLSDADLSHLHPAVIAALSPTAPNPLCIANDLAWLSNAYKPCSMLDQQQLSVIIGHGMELSRIDCGFTALYEACLYVSNEQSADYHY